PSRLLLALPLEQRDEPAGEYAGVDRPASWRRESGASPERGEHARDEYDAREREAQRLSSPRANAARPCERFFPSGSARPDRCRRAGDADGLRQPLESPAHADGVARTRDRDPR